jgi:fatty acid desaturase
MWPGKWKFKVFLSDIGIFVMLGILSYWANATSITYVFLRYGLPWMVINFFLVFYNLLTHTDVDIPYFDEDNWEHVKGSFQTIERPFGAFLDFMHHGIGSTHVAHHVNP